MFIIAMAGATCAAALLTLGRVVGFKRIIKHATLVDVVFSIGVVAVLGTTMTGALTAVLAGLFMAVGLSIAKSIASVGDVVPNLWAKVQDGMHARRQVCDAAWGDVTPCTAPPVPETPAARPANAYTGGPVVIML